ncbi:hypothetical protein Bbelb_093000 [Branchiostoma belcheri]|nr:hypothetical protein Bbelb_093000 [Branchiostoma belcheri]
MGRDSWRLTAMAPNIEVISAWPSADLYYLETLTLTCYGGGDPAPTYTWTLDSGPVPARAVVDTAAGTLTLADATDADGGVYTCTADNGVGTAATLDVTVVGCPDVMGSCGVAAECSTQNQEVSTCTDLNANCPSWASGGQCESNPGYMIPNCPLSCGECFPNLGAQCTNTRRGRSWDTWECYDVTTVPDDVRSDLSLDAFYQKYLHAYGIPILGSSILPDDALRRACYDVLFLLADRKDVRDSYYNYYGRAAIMDDTEVTLDIPEHSGLDASFNTRARGLGATVSKPVSTGAEENVLCFSNDSYRVEDIFIHEFAHGLDILGARKVVSDFETRLQTAYDDALANGLWANTYAAVTRDEYWAEGVQSFFNVNHERDPPDGIHNHVNTRTELQAYDPDLYAIIEDIFPCGNFPVKRCVRDYASYTLKMDCFSANHQRLTVVGNAVWGDAFTTTPASQGTTLTPAASTPTVSQTPTVSRTPAVSTPTTHTASIAPQSTGTTPTVGQTPSVSTPTVSTPTLSTQTVLTSRATTRVASTMAQFNPISGPGVYIYSNNTNFGVLIKSGNKYSSVIRYLNNCRADVFQQDSNSNGGRCDKYCGTDNRYNTDYYTGIFSKDTHSSDYPSDNTYSKCTGAAGTTPTAGRSTAGASSVTPLPSTTMSRAPLASTSTAHAGTTPTISSASSTAVPSTTTGAAVTPVVTTTTNPTGSPGTGADRSTPTLVTRLVTTVNATESLPKPPGIDVAIIVAGVLGGVACVLVIAAAIWGGLKIAAAKTAVVAIKPAP